MLGRSKLPGLIIPAMELIDAPRLRYEADGERATSSALGLSIFDSRRQRGRFSDRPLFIAYLCVFNEAVAAMAARSASSRVSACSARSRLAAARWLRRAQPGRDASSFVRGGPLDVRAAVRAGPLDARAAAPCLRSASASLAARHTELLEAAERPSGAGQAAAGTLRQGPKWTQSESV